MGTGEEGPGLGSRHCISFERKIADIRERGPTYRMRNPTSCLLIL